MFKDIDIKFVDKEITPFGGLSLFLKMVEPVVSEPLNTVGNQENTVGKSLMVVFVCMCLGVAVGSIAIPVGLSVPMKLGLAGGPLIVAILIGHFGTKKGLIDHNVTSGASMSMLRELGISLFLASVGLSAGGSFVQTIVDGGYMWVVYGVAITMMVAAA